MPAPICLLTIAMLLVGWRDGSPQTIGGQFVTIVQRDGQAGPVDAPSARVSARGRYVVFASYARLVPEDTNHVRDVYVFDLWTRRLTLESPGVRGTVANGEPRLVRLQEHAMDLAPSGVMLISHHRDRPGTVGRVGALLGAADVNISSMTLARSAPRADAYMVLALDDDIPQAVVDALAADEGIIDTWVVRLGNER